MTSARYDYIGRNAQKMMSEKVRDRRQRALDLVSDFHVSASNNGSDVKEQTFDTMPTLAQLAETFGADAFLVGIEKRRRLARSEHARPVMIQS